MFMVLKRRSCSEHEVTYALTGRYKWSLERLNVRAIISAVRSNLCSSSAFGQGLRSNNKFPMTIMRITVENFSCIKRADVELAGLNVLIGPQASGKSVISKLIFFCLDVHSQVAEGIAQERTFDAFTDDIKQKFGELFPLSAWGKEKFKIVFKAEAFEVKIARSSYNDEVKNSIRLSLSPAVKEIYKAGLELVKSSKVKTAITQHAHVQDFELKWKLRQQIAAMVHRQFPKSSPNNLTFIPAGRSFFTNLGKAFLAFDQGRLLDPITVRFGRLYSSLISERYYFELPKSREIVEELAKILGGELVHQGDRISIKCADGRDIPLSALSSGQQELLPLFVAFDFLHNISADLGSSPQREKRPEITFIEEPEAHLFPSAQSRLLQALVGFVNVPQLNRQLILTTHSPYVLSKINNLIKAGDLEKRLSKSYMPVLNSLIPKRSRLTTGTVRAYAIVEGVTRSILDEDGLINADYLDDISNEIGNEFSKLLELEFQE